MKIKSIVAAACIAALSSTPVLAAPANSAASLSVAKSVRASAPAKKGNKLAAPGAIIGLIGAAAIIAGGVIIAVDDDNSDSN